MEVLVQVIFFGGHGVSGSQELVVKDTVSLEPPEMYQRKDLNKIYVDSVDKISWPIFKKNKKLCHH